MIFNGITYSYINGRFINVGCERDIEIPIIMDLISSYNKENTLEVGNVLNSYGLIDTDVLDKYEIGDGIINKDIRIYKSNKLYHCVVSVTTLEHVGKDDDPKESNGIISAIRNILDLLFDGGCLFFTVPVGYNKDMDQLFRDNKVPVSELYAIKRVSEDNKWEQCSIEDALTHQYGYPFWATNSSLIGVVKK
jgi:hypothetical protein